jgi:ABC-2 type transport system ATP-binding protein
MHGCPRGAGGRVGLVALPVKALKAGQEAYWLDQIARNREEYLSGRGESPGRFVGMTGRENLEMVARLFGQDRASARANSTRVLAQLGLAEDADRLVRTYSGGMRRKLDLGASLVGAPRLLLLDEPTTGLDPGSRIDLWDAIRELVEQGTNVLLTTQYLDEADRLADEIVIIDDGRAIAYGTPAELKRRTGRNVVEVHVRDRGDLAQVAQALTAIGSSQAQVDESTHRVTVVVEGGTEQLNRALAPLEQRAVALEEVALRQPRLDEVLLALTGHVQSQTPTDDPVGPAAASGSLNRSNS